jgi:hypothetical protein
LRGAIKTYFTEKRKKGIEIWGRLTVRKNWRTLGSAYAKIDYPMAENAKITPALIQFSGRGQELRDVWLLARVAW